MRQTNHLDRMGLTNSAKNFVWSLDVVKSVYCPPQARQKGFTGVFDIPDGCDPAAIVKSFFDRQVVWTVSNRTEGDKTKVCISFEVQLRGDGSAIHVASQYAYKYPGCRATIRGGNYDLDFTNCVEANDANN